MHVILLAEVVCTAIDRNTGCVSACALKSLLKGLYRRGHKCTVRSFYITMLMKIRDFGLRADFS